MIQITIRLNTNLFTDKLITRLDYNGQPKTYLITDCLYLDLYDKTVLILQSGSETRQMTLSDNKHNCFLDDGFIVVENK